MYLISLDVGKLYCFERYSIWEMAFDTYMRNTLIGVEIKLEETQFEYMCYHLEK